MKVIVTGGAGYIGSVCVEELLNAGHEVVVFDNLSEGHRGAIDDRAKLIVGDLQDKPSISRAMSAEKPDSVMHFAANSLVGESMKNPSKYFINNNYGSVNLFDAMVENGVGHLVFSSTCAIFGHPTKVPIDENMPTNPINTYGESKLITELMLRWYQQIHGLSFTSLRYFNAAGATEKYGEDHRQETHLIPNILKAALGQKPYVEIYGTDYDTPDGTCIRDYIHIVDLAQAHILALDKSKSGYYNLGTGSGTSVREVIAACERSVGKPIPVKESARRSGDPARLIAASQKATSELGWHPRHQDIDQIAKSAWAWHQKHPNGYPDPHSGFS